MRRTKRIASITSLFVGAILLGTLIRALPAQQPEDQHEDNDSRVRQGFTIAPVHLNLEGKNHALVGLGSYIVNSQADCNACHTCPSFKPGHSPFMGGDGLINTDGYLAGGTPFGPFISRNITPDASGQPAGLSFNDFRLLIRSGVDPDHQTPLLQVMPWPAFRKMTDHDLHAIYEYLSAIPSNSRQDGPPAGPCTGPDQ